MPVRTETTFEENIYCNFRLLLEDWPGVEADHWDVFHGQLVWRVAVKVC